MGDDGEERGKRNRAARKRAGEWPKVRPLPHDVTLTKYFDDLSLSCGACKEKLIAINTRKTSAKPALLCGSSIQHV